MAGKSRFYHELIRRRVFRAAAVYAAVAFVVAQVAELVLPGLLLPEWTFRLIILLLFLGFPIVLVLAWYFDITPAGGQGDQDGEAGAAASAPAPAGDHPLAALRSARGAGLVGVGMLIALVAFGGYHFIGPSSDPEEYADGAERGEHSIAVLPFTNMAGGEENEYFADGITEDILTNLGLVPDFTVISRTSVMRYKGSDRSVPDIAQELGVRYVLEGSLRRSGDRVRVVTQLIEPGTDTQVWAQTLDRRIDDIFAVQSEIAQAVVDALRVELAGGVSERIRRAPTADVAAYELFLVGRDYYHQYSRTAIQQAMELFQQAIERDPDFALAHAWLAAARAVYVFNYRGETDLIESALASARHAIRLQPDLGDAHRALGTTFATTGRFDEAVSALERALSLNPNDFAAIGNLGLSYALQGEWDRAIDLTLRSMERDPARSYIAYGNLSDYYRYLGLDELARDAAHNALALRRDEIVSTASLAWIELGDGRVDEAVARLERLAVDTDDPHALGALGHILLMVGDQERARGVLERAVEAAPDALPVQEQAPAVLLAYVLARGGENRRAEELLAASERITRDAIEAGNAAPAMEYSLASIAAIQGRSDAALDHLERAVGRGWNAPRYTLRDPILAPIRNEPRFRAALERIQARNGAMRERVERRSGT